MTLIEQLLFEIGPELEQLNAEFLPLSAFAFEIGFARAVAAFEFAFIGQIKLTAFSNELSSNVVAFFGFS